MTPVIMYRRERIHVAVTSKTSLGRLLKLRRDELDFPQDDIADALGFVQPYISKLERGSLDKTILKWKPERIWTMLKAYKYSDNDARVVAKQFDLDIPYDKIIREEKPNPLESFRYDEGWEYFQVHTSASAGSGEPEIIDGEVAVISKRALQRRGISEDAKHEVMPVKVNGNCLVSQNVRFSTKNVSHGDVVFIHLGAPPQDGDRVCCFDHSDNQLIIKFYKEQQDPTQPDLITFYDARGMQYVRKTDDIDYRGVVFFRIGEL